MFRLQTELDTANWSFGVVTFGNDMEVGFLKIETLQYADKTQTQTQTQTKRRGNKCTHKFTALLESIATDADTGNR